MVRLVIFMSMVLSHFLMAEPTAEREWTSVVGSKITAKATTFRDGSVTLLTDKGRKLVLPITKLSKEDQDFIAKHFKPKALKIVEYEKATDSGHLLGKMIGPIEAAAGSTYYIYLPKTLAADSKAPLLFWTGSVRSGGHTLHKFVEAAELGGMALAASVESWNRDADTFKVNNNHTRVCLNHIESHYPVEIKRVFFSGGSGGGASALYNAGELDCLGALPYIGYIPPGSTPSKKGFYYFATGARDFNRYASANGAKEYEKRAMHRLYPGGHNVSGSDIAVEGLLWLYTRHIYEKGRKYALELSRFEPRLCQWLVEREKDKPYEVYFWTDHLLNTCKVRGEFKLFLQDMNTRLAKDKANEKYLNGYRAIVKFSRDVLAPAHGGDSSSGHTTTKIQKEATKLKEEFAGVPRIEKIAEELLRNTQKH